MIKHNITGTEIFEIDKPFFDSIESSRQYSSINTSIGYPLNADYLKPYKRKHVVGYDYSRKNDLYLPGVTESRSVYDIKINPVNHKKRQHINPCFYDLFPSNHNSNINPKDVTYIDDIIKPPKLDKPVIVENTKAIELGVIGYSEKDMVIKKMTQDNIDESKDDAYYENFLHEHLQKKYDRLYPKNTTPTPTPTPIPPSTPTLSIPIQPPRPPLQPPQPSSLALSLPLPPPNQKKKSTIPTQNVFVGKADDVKVEEPIKKVEEPIKKVEEVEKVEEKKSEKQREKEIEEENKRINLLGNKKEYEYFVKNHPLVNKELESVLNMYQNSDKIDEKGKSKLNEVLLNCGKKTLHGNIYKIDTVKIYFIKRFMEDVLIYKPVMKRINPTQITKDEFDYLDYPYKSVFSGKPP